MIKVILGVVLGIGVATTFPKQTTDLSEFMREQIHSGAKAVADQTDQSTLDKLRECAKKGIVDCK